MTSTVAPNSPASARPVPARQVWAASGLRRMTLSFTFLILLPFYASIGPMLFTRISHGLVGDAIWLGILGLAFTAIMGLLLIQLVHAIRNRVVIDNEKLSFTLPSVAGNIAGTAFFTKSIPLKDIRAVETREEIYGKTLAPVRLVSTRIVPNEGQPVVLGFTNPENTDQTFPFPMIGQAVADRTGTKVVAHGAVRRSAAQRILGQTGQSQGPDAVTPDEIAAIKTRHGHAMRAIIAGFVLLIIGGIAIDLLTASRTSFATFTSDASTQKMPDGKKR